MRSRCLAPRLLVPLLICVPVWGCVPPPSTAGFVSPVPASPGNVDLSADILGGRGLNYPSFASGGLHVDRYATAQTSIPITIGGGWLALPTGFGNARLGVRHRLEDGLAFGLGTGPVVAFGQGGSASFGQADVEALFGGRVGHFRWSTAWRAGTVFSDRLFAPYLSSEGVLGYQFDFNLTATAHLIAAPFGATYSGSPNTTTGAGVIVAGGLGIAVSFF